MSRFYISKILIQQALMYLTLIEFVHHALKMLRDVNKSKVNYINVKNYSLLLYILIYDNNDKRKLFCKSYSI